MSSSQTDHHWTLCRKLDQETTAKELRCRESCPYRVDTQVARKRETPETKSLFDNSTRFSDFLCLGCSCFRSTFMFILFSLLALCSASSSFNHSTPVDVFVKGEDGYFCVKIPALLVTKSGVLLAFGEARRDSCSDYTKTDLVQKHSRDGGKTCEDCFSCSFLPTTKKGRI